MARRKGDQQDSRAALLDAAWALLLEQGTQGMSVEAIVTRAGLSKGTFFHFFPAKQALLDALCARIADESEREAMAVLARRDVDPVVRLDLYLEAGRVWRLERSRAVGGLWRELTRRENAALLQQLRTVSFERMTPPLARLFAEANELGRMNVPDPEVVARLVVEWMSATVEGSLRLFLERRDAGAIELAARRANATMDALERVLGIEAGALRRVDRDAVARLAAGVPGEAEEVAGGAERRTSKKGKRHVRSARDRS